MKTRWQPEKGTDRKVETDGKKEKKEREIVQKDILNENVQQKEKERRMMKSTGFYSDFKKLLFSPKLV